MGCNTRCLEFDRRRLGLIHLFAVNVVTPGFLSSKSSLFVFPIVEGGPLLSSRLALCGNQNPHSKSHRSKVGKSSVPQCQDLCLCGTSRIDIIIEEITASNCTCEEGFKGQIPWTPGVQTSHAPHKKMRKHPNDKTSSEKQLGHTEIV